MPVYDEKIDAIILECAREEFLEKGYKNATLRDICAKANVTTGAMYKRYRNKQELFDVLVLPALQVYQNLKNQSVEASYTAKDNDSMKEIWNNSLESYQYIMTLIYSQKTAFQLLLCCASGSEQERFVDELVDEITEETMKFCKVIYAEKNLPNLPDADAVHILLTAYYNCIFEPVKHDFSLEKALHFCETLENLFHWENVFQF